MTIVGPVNRKSTFYKVMSKRIYMTQRMSALGLPEFTYVQMSMTEFGINNKM